MPRAPSALVVAPPGPGRRATVAQLESLGFQVRAAAEPYEGTARFVERPAALVVVSLAAFGRRDRAFLRAVRRRAPDARILLLVPQGRRNEARRALEAGADAALPEPYYAEELVSLVRALLPRRSTALDLRGDAGQAVRHLAQEVAHAVNNPLQVLRLVAEQEGRSKKSTEALLEHVDRIRDAVRVLERFTRLSTPTLAEVRPGLVLSEVLQGAEASGRIHLVSPTPARGPLLTVDPGQLRSALEDMLEVLAAQSPTTPAPVKAGVRRPPAEVLELAIKARGARLGKRRFQSLQGRVIWNHADTRRAHPGLAGASLIARQHGGRLVRRRGRGGVILALRLPLP